MNWGRAKTVLIISFFMLNILLGFQMYTRWDQATSSATAVIKEELVKLLESRNISLAFNKVPKETPKLRAVYYKEKINHTDTQPIADPFSSSTILRSIPSVDAMEKAGVVSADAYRYDPATSHKGESKMFHQMKDGLPMFDVALQLIEDNGKITGYNQSYVEVQSGVDGKEQEVISAYTALRSVLESSLEENTAITDIRLGYHGQRFNTETQYMLPNWRIVLDTGDIYYVQAFNGAVEKPAEKDK